MLGTGGFGTVYAAQRKDGRALAVKVAPPGVAASRLKAEEAALIAAGPKVGPAFEASGELPDGGRWLAMERLGGQSLAALLEASEHGLSPDRALELAHSLLRALGALHASGWLHLDLKPDNVFVEPEGVRLIDFGNAVRLGEPVPPGAGTAESMGPEQAAGGVLAETADLYAFGVLVFELATGRPPFFGPASEVLTSHRERRPPRVSALNPAAAPLELLISACLAKDAEARPHTAAEAEAILVRGAQALPLPPPSAPLSAPVPASTSQRRTVGLIFFETERGLVAVREAAATLGADIAATLGNRWALAFDAGGSENLAQRALVGARQLLSMGLAARVQVDVLPAVVQRRPNGERRYSGASLSHKENWPRPDAPEPLQVSPRARGLVTQVELQTPSAQATGVGSTQLQITPAEAPFHGRSAEVAALAAAAVASRRGEPTIVRVLAEPGLGKSRLLREVGKQAQERGDTALTVRGRELSGEDARTVLRELLTQVLPPGAEPWASATRVLAARLPAEALEPAAEALAFAMGWLDPARAAAVAQRLSPAVLRANLAQAAGELLRARAAGNPTVVLVDDAHLVGDDVLDALEYAALSGQGTRLLVVAGARPAFAAGRPSFGSRAQNLVQLELGPMDEVAAEALCRELLLPADQVSSEIVRKLIGRTAGSPRLLVELVRGLRDEGLLARRPRGEGYVVVSEVVERVPDLPLVEWLARRELDQLGPELLGHARAAAVMASFTSAELRAVVERLDASGHSALVPLDARAGLKRLVERGLVVRGPGGVYRFRLSSVRERVEHDMPAAIASALHRARWELLSTPGAEKGHAQLAQVARHAAACGEPAAAIDAWLEAGREAQRLHALVDADIAFSRALVLLPATDPRCGEARRRRGVTRYRLARYGEAMEDFRLAVELAQEGQQARFELEALLWWATALDWTSDFTGARSKVQRARALYDAHPEPELLATLLYNEGRGDSRFEAFGPGIEKLQRAAELCAAGGVALYETRIEALVMLLYFLPTHRGQAAAEAVLSEIDRLCTEAGDRFHAAGAALNSRTIYLGRGDLPGALLAQERAAQIGRELGEQLIEYGAWCNKADLLCVAGRGAEALAAARTVRALELKYPEVVSSPFGTLLQARAAALVGDRTEVQKQLAELEVLLERGRAQGQSSTELLPNEQVQLEGIKLELASDSVDAWAGLSAKARDAGYLDEWLELLSAWSRARPQDAPLIRQALETHPELGLRPLRERVMRELASL